MSFTIRVDDLRGPAIAALLAEHLAQMRASSPACSVHALDLEALRAPEVTMWGVWSGDDLAGCGAIKQLDPHHGELKSMRTAAGFLRRGVAGLLLAHMVEVARERGYRRLSLETGSTPPFAAAIALYRRHGFVSCEPFADYRHDAFSTYMTLALDS